MTGLPRSGTTYLAAVLHHPPATIVLSEAGGRWKRLHADQPGGEGFVREFEWSRERVRAGEPVATFEGTPGFRGEQRVDTWNQPKVERTLDRCEEFAFGMKNPEVFLAWLDVILEHMPCVVSVRHPLGVLNSWVAHTRDRVEGTFADGAAATHTAPGADAIERRVRLHNHFVSQILAQHGHANLLVVRYEDWFLDPSLLGRIGQFLRVDVREELRPAPIAPDVVTLPPDEQAYILESCRLVEPLGYPVEDGRLLAPAKLADRCLPAN